MTEIVTDGNFIYVTFFDKNIIKFICWLDDCCFSWICVTLNFESTRAHLIPRNHYNNNMLSVIGF